MSFGQTSLIDGVMTVRTGTVDYGLPPPVGGPLSRGKLIVTDEKQGLPDDSVTAIGSDHSGTIWIGTMRSGLYRLQDGVIAPYGAKMSLGVGSTRSTKTSITISGFARIMGWYA